MLELLLLLSGGLVLLMPKSALAYVGGQPVSIDLVDIGDGHLLERNAAAAFLRMKEAAQSAGIALVVSEAFRTMEMQQFLYDQFIGRAPGAYAAATPGYSKHQSGKALDLRVGGSFESNESKWLRANGARFGWAQPGWAGPDGSTKEPHHFEFTGNGVA